jgi:hypothetical protein
MGEQVETLEDLLRPGLRAVCVGINPAPTSVAAVGSARALAISSSGIPRPGLAGSGRRLRGGRRHRNLERSRLSARLPLCSRVNRPRVWIQERVAARMRSALSLADVQDNSLADLRPYGWKRAFNFARFVLAERRRHWLNASLEVRFDELVFSLFLGEADYVGHQHCFGAWLSRLNSRWPRSRTVAITVARLKNRNLADHRNLNCAGLVEGSQHANRRRRAVAGGHQASPARRRRPLPLRRRCQPDGR